MIKGSKKIIEQGTSSTPEAQPVAFKATEEKKEESTSSRQPIDASKLDNKEMTLIIKSFRQILKQRRGKDYKPRSKKVCYKCGKPGHFIAKCPMSSDSDRGDDKKGKRRKKKRYYKKKGGDAHVCREWDSDESSTDSSSDEDAANIVVTKGLLFPNVGHKCLMAKDDKMKKVKSKSSTKYESSSDEEVNLLTLFANLNMEQKEKLNELISAIHEKDDLLDSQEDFIIKENKKHVKVKNAYALEVEKCEKLSSELSTCHDTIVNLRNENAKLIAKVDSHVCNVSTSNPRDDNVDLFARIDELNVSLASLRIENEKLLAKAPMPQDNEGYILYPTGYPKSKIRRIHSRKSHSGPNHAFMYKGEASSSRQPTRAKLPKRRTPNASNDHDISFKTFDASYVLTNKSGKIVAKFVGGKHKGSKTCVWVPKVLVSNAKGPKTVWVPKVKN
jgi:hypothetical protein